MQLIGSSPGSRRCSKSQAVTAVTYSAHKSHEQPRTTRARREKSLALQNVRARTACFSNSTFVLLRRSLAFTTPSRAMAPTSNLSYFQKRFPTKSWSLFVTTQRLYHKSLIATAASKYVVRTLDRRPSHWKITFAYSWPVPAIFAQFTRSILSANATTMRSRTRKQCDQILASLHYCEKYNEREWRTVCEVRNQWSCDKSGAILSHISIRFLVRGLELEDAVLRVEFLQCDQ